MTITLAQRVEIALGRAEYAMLIGAAARLFGFREDRASIGGVDMPFYARGSGPAVLLVHGFGADKESWLLLGRLLRTRVTVLIPDLPGFGAAGAIAPAKASARAQAAALAGFLDHLGFARAHLVGNSMGGGIALRFARDLPARAASLTLIGSVGPHVEASELGRALDRGENPLIVEEPDDLDGLLEFISERRLPMTRALRRYVAHERYERRHVHRDLFEAWRSTELHDGDGVPADLEAITTPALVVHGALDRVIHPATGDALAARMPNARIERMAGVGHVPQMEAPRKVARWIDALVREVEAGRRR